MILSQKFSRKFFFDIFVAVDNLSALANCVVSLDITQIILFASRNQQINFRVVLFVGFRGKFKIIQRSFDVDRIIFLFFKINIIHCVVVIFFGKFGRNFDSVLRKFRKFLAFLPSVENFFVSVLNFSHINYVVHNRRSFHSASERQMIVADFIPIVCKVNCFLNVFFLAESTKIVKSHVVQERITKS